jgi:hypoxanthine phosphoribosyltransferase
VNFRSVRDLNEAIAGNLSRIPRDVDLVVGIPRSGLLAANLVALHLNLPLTDLDGLLEGRRLRSGPRLPQRGAARHALVIDDSVLGGATMQSARDRIDKAGPDCKITYAAVYVCPESRNDVDLFLEEIVGPRVFEWNLLHSGMIGRSCVDIDGVLCIDPTERQNDDGPRYRRFLETARPLLLPTVPVGWLVTCRLNRYRELTEQWLGRHDVHYSSLYMMNLPSKAARLASGSHASFKAEVYQLTDALLFVESSHRQAVSIAQIRHMLGFDPALRTR